MLKLLKKDFSLFLVKPTLLFFLLTVTMLIPAYPAIVTAFFGFFILQICYQTAQTNRDIEFTAMLPVARKQIVLSKLLFTSLIQIAYLIACIPFAVISSVLLNPQGNVAGMDKNIAFFGYALLALVVFNIIFFTLYFKNTHKIGLAIAMALIGYFVFAALFEIVVAVVPTINGVLDTLNPEMILPQTVFFVCCIVIYGAAMLLTYKLSTKAFEKMVI